MNIPLPLWKEKNCLAVGDNLMLRQNHHWYKILAIAVTQSDIMYSLSNNLNYFEEEIQDMFICKGTKIVCIESQQLIDYDKVAEQLY